MKKFGPFQFFFILNTSKKSNKIHLLFDPAPTIVFHHYYQYHYHYFSILGTQTNKSLVTFRNSSSRSAEVCCNDKHLKACLDVDVDPKLLLSMEDISINHIDLEFKFTIEPNGFVYKNPEGDEAIITFNSKTGNMCGSLITHDHKSYAIEKCRNGYVWEVFDTESFEPDLAIEIDADQILSRQKYVDQAVRDDTSHVTYSIMVYYTPDFASVTPDIEVFVDQALAKTNEGYKNSLIPLTIKLLCIEEATVNDIADTSALIKNFINMKGSLKALRNTADAAVLLVRKTNLCGIG